VVRSKFVRAKFIAESKVAEQVKVPFEVRTQLFPLLVRMKVLVL